MYRLILAFLISASLFGCSNKQNEAQQSEAVETAGATPNSYQFQSSHTSIKWTAFKTTARVAVGGYFTAFEVNPGKESGTPMQLMDGLTFSIPVSGSSSENAERDLKIAKFFYGKMLNTDTITGQITSLNGTDSAGSARIKITLNGVDHEVDGLYSISGTKVVLKASLNLGDWKAEPAVQSLNKVCNDLHKGEDGVSKLWPEVDVVVESVLLPSAIQ